MNAVDILFDYLRTIREAKKYLYSGRGGRLSANDIIELTALARHLSELEPDKTDILAIEVEWSCPSDETLDRTRQKVISECNSFTELYLENQEVFDKLCSYKSVFELINNKAESEFYFSKEAANKEVKKWRTIFDKYNDITRLYNSMDCRPGEEEEDMRIINGYIEELYDMIGHPIYLENVNKEHNEAHDTLRQKKQEKEDIEKKTRERYYELNEKVDSDVLYTISSYAESLASAFKAAEESNDTLDYQEKPIQAIQVVGSLPEQEPMHNPPQKRKRGRPSKKDRYSEAGIKDFKSCFTSNDYYNLIVSEITKEPVNSICGKVSYCIVNCLFISGYLKNEVRSTHDLAKFMIDEFPTQFHISSGTSSYDNNIDEETESDWRRRLSVENLIV